MECNGDNPDVGCPVCFEAYNNSCDRRPKILPCGHSFCEKCLETCSALQRPFRCPICKKQHKLEACDVKKLITNFSLLSTRAGNPKAPVNNENTNPKCAKHGKVSTNHCIECERDLCQTCVMDGLSSGEHKGHTVASFEEAFGIRLRKIDDYHSKIKKIHMEMAKDHTEKVNEFHSDIESLRHEVNVDADQAIAKINKSRQNCLSILDKVSKDVVDSLGKDVDAIGGALDSLSEELATFLEKVNVDENAKCNMQSIEGKIKTFEETLKKFDPESRFPNIRLSVHISVSLGKLGITSKETAASAQQPPQPTLRQDVNVSKFHSYATDGVFRVQGSPTTLVYLCHGHDRARLLNRMAPDAVVWGLNTRPDLSGTNVIEVNPNWTGQLVGIEIAEKQAGYRSVALCPAISKGGSIEPLVAYLNTRPSPLEHVCVLHDDQFWVNRWTRQLLEDGGRVAHVA